MVKDFLSRNRIPYQWLDIETDDEARQMVEKIVVWKNTVCLLCSSRMEVIGAARTACAWQIKSACKRASAQPFYDFAITLVRVRQGLAAAVYAHLRGCTLC